MTFNKSKFNAPTVKLLGTIKGVVIPETAPEQITPPRRCVKCRSCFEIRKKETLCPRCRLVARREKLIKSKQLFARTCERMRRALLLPAELEKTPLAKCRPLRHLLDIFVECFPLSEQKLMTDEETKYRLFELPDLPPVFAKLLKENDNENDEADANILPPLDYKKLRRQNKCQAPAQRQPVSAALFAEVARKRGSFCFWCDVKVIRIAHIPRENRVMKNNSTVTYLSAEGRLREEFFLTIDHLVCVADGSGNNVENLVISCYPCNQKREQNKASEFIADEDSDAHFPCGNMTANFFDLLFLPLTL